MNRVKAVVKLSPHSQLSLSQAIGISANAVNKICKNETQPSIKRLYEIAEILKCSIYDLLEPNEHPSILTSGEASAVHGSERSTADKVEANTKDIAEMKVEIKELKNQLN